MKVSPYILLSLTSLFWSFNFIIGKIVSDVIPPTSVNFFRWLLPFLIFFPLNLKEVKANKTMFLDKWGLILLLGVTGYCLNSIFPSVLAYRFWNSALRKVSANKVGIFLYLIPIYTTVISILFLKESLKLFQIFGGLLIFAGVMLVTRSSFSKKTSEVQAQ